MKSRLAALEAQVLDANGGVYRSRDSGTTWTLQGSLPDRAEAFLATSARLYAAVHEIDVQQRH